MFNFHTFELIVSNRYYCSEKRNDGTIGNPSSLLQPSTVAQDMDESNIQFEVKLLETMEKVHYYEHMSMGLACH